MQEGDAADWAVCRSQVPVSARHAGVAFRKSHIYHVICHDLNAPHTHVGT
jgi:hypothetical protein